MGSAAERGIGPPLSFHAAFFNKEHKQNRIASLEHSVLLWPWSRQTSCGRAQRSQISQFSSITNYGACLPELHLHQSKVLRTYMGFGAERGSVSSEMTLSKTFKLPEKPPFSPGSSKAGIIPTLQGIFWFILIYVNHQVQCLEPLQCHFIRETLLDPRKELLLHNWVHSRFPVFITNLFN